MIQFNLLPDVKVQYLKAEHARKVVTIVAVAVTVGSLVLLGLIYSINIYKTKQLASLSKEIETISARLAKETDVDKKLTVQNQLSSLTKLHDGKPAAPRLFGYLNQITPNNVVGISEFKIDYLVNTISISGVADSLSSVNKYVDTIKFTNYTLVKTDAEKAQGDIEPPKERAFSAVVLSEYSFETKDDKSGPVALPATFTINMTYAPVIFDNVAKVRLEVPSIITTRSAVNLPSELLKASPKATEEGSGGTN